VYRGLQLETIISVRQNRAIETRGFRAMPLTNREEARVL
jgi:hypothetical protein